MAVNWRQSETCIVINDKSQGSIAKHLSWDGFVYYKFIAQFANVRMFKIGEHLAKLRTVVSCFLTHSVYHRHIGLVWTLCE